MITRERTWAHVATCFGNNGLRSRGTLAMWQSSQNNNKKRFQLRLVILIIAAMLHAACFSAIKLTIIYRALRCKDDDRMEWPLRLRLVVRFRSVAGFAPSLDGVYYFWDITIMAYLLYIAKSTPPVRSSAATRRTGRVRDESWGKKRAKEEHWRRMRMMLLVLLCGWSWRRSWSPATRFADDRVGEKWEESWRAHLEIPNF